MWGFMRFKEPDVTDTGIGGTTRAGWTALPPPGPPQPAQSQEVGEAPLPPPPATRCADGWWHSLPIDLLAETDSATGAYDVGTPGVLQLVAPPFEYSVWVDGCLVGIFPPDPTAVVLAFPAADQLPEDLLVVSADHGEASSSRRNSRLPALPGARPAEDARSSRPTSAASSNARRLSARPPTAGHDSRLFATTPRLSELWEEAEALQTAGHLANAEAAYLELADKADTADRDLCLYHAGVLAETRGDYFAADCYYGEAETSLMAQQLDEPGDDSQPPQLLLRVRMGISNLLDHQGHEEAAERLAQDVHAAQARV
eukprot:SAG22_NODE_57_length_23647_cov_11.746688_4_plen_314_part_00